MIRFDFSEFERAAKAFSDKALDQVPFALARALNDGAEKAREHIIGTTWPGHVQVRDPNFMKATLTTAGKRATKRDLSVELYDKLNRGHLGLHHKGGAKPARKTLAIPENKVKGRRTARGVPKSLRPLALPNSFRKGDVIYQRTGRRKSKRLKLMYVLKRSAPIKATVPFMQDFEAVMRREVRLAFSARLAEAMRTRR